MIETIFYITIGTFIGWNCPQPAYAKAIQEKVVAWFKGLGNRNK